MKTTRDARRMFVSWLHDPTSDRMSVRAWAVGEDMAKDCDELEAKCTALQAESDAHTKWLEEVWPTIEDRVLGDLVRERDEALAKVAALRLAIEGVSKLVDAGRWTPSLVLAALRAALDT